jgi:hypothetical protein
MSERTTALTPCAQGGDDIAWTNIGRTKYSVTFTGKSDLIGKLTRLFRPIDDPKIP